MNGDERLNMPQETAARHAEVTSLEQLVSVLSGLRHGAPGLNLLTQARVKPPREEQPELYACRQTTIGETGCEPSSRRSRQEK